MDVALISPTKLLETTARSNGCFVLSHRMLNDKDYARWICENAYRFKWVLVDNDAYEFINPTPFSVVMHFARMIDHPKTYVVLPDVLRNATLTIRLIKKVIGTLDSRFQYCAVVQGRTFESARQCLDDLMKLECVDMIAIPTHMYRRFNKFARIQLAKMVEGKSVHFLGLDDPREIANARNIVRSVDTSLPYTLAWHWKKVQMRRLHL
ncbi:MAG: hypothetical protein QXS54_08535, partial [Candidatus Methanomethylicaceae archaeon]